LLHHTSSTQVSSTHQSTRMAAACRTPRNRAAPMPQPALRAKTRNRCGAGLGALLADLKQDGTLDQTLIVAVGGIRPHRRPGDTKRRPRPSCPAIGSLYGAKVVGTRAIGSTDPTGAAIADPGWSKGREVKPEDIEATIYSALCIDWTTLRHDDPLNCGFEFRFLVPYKMGTYNFLTGAVHFSLGFLGRGLPLAQLRRSLAFGEAHGRTPLDP
jgi:hypothetical protein